MGLPVIDTKANNHVMAHFLTRKYYTCNFHELSKQAKIEADIKEIESRLDEMGPGELMETMLDFFRNIDQIKIDETVFKQLKDRAWKSINR